MKTYLVITAALVVLFGAASCGDSDTPGSPAATADLEKVSDRWQDMTEGERQAVCTAASGPLPGEGEIGGTATSSPDYRAMLDAIEEAGFTQSEAAAMIPYALNECR